MSSVGAMRFFFFGGASAGAPSAAGASSAGPLAGLLTGVGGEMSVGAMRFFFTPEPGDAGAWE